MTWLLRARPPSAEVVIGTGVRQLESCIFEGSWVGGPGADGLLGSTTPFGSGVVAAGAELWIVPPGHTLEGVYIHRAGNALTASNSLVALLVGTGLELDPAVDYMPLFDASVRGRLRTAIPTSDGPIEACFYDNLAIDLDGRPTTMVKPREAPFTDFANYRARLSAALASVLVNAPEGVEPVNSISSGYDSAAVAVISAEQGLRRALTISDGKRVKGSASLDDSGEAVARHLGMAVERIDRAAYLRRTDLPEAEFLASGFTGEEVVFRAMEDGLRGGMLLTGFYGDGMFWMNRPRRPLLWRSDQSGSSFGEWRLRTGFIHVPLTCFGSHDYRVTQFISRSAEMRPWVIGQRDDRPIPRRILEEAGIRRGTFARRKRAASGTIHVEGPTALAQATRASLDRFAAGEGHTVRFLPRGLRRWERVVLKVSRRVGLEKVAARVERRKLRLSVTESAFGNLLLRWAVSVVRERYAELAEPADDTAARAS
ncbi:hypothetical protein BH24CHL5_BH24CHL5_06830 [soil metagenome]